jgi:hypothetical protein
VSLVGRCGPEEREGGHRSWRPGGRTRGVAAGCSRRKKKGGGKEGGKEKGEKGKRKRKRIKGNRKKENKGRKIEKGI